VNKPKRVDCIIKQTTLKMRRLDIPASFFLGGERERGRKIF